MQKNSFCRMLAPLLLVLLFAGTLVAQSGEVIYTFQGGSNGQYPTGAPVIDSTGDLFGIAYNDYLGGTLLAYELSPSGSGWNYQVIYQFPAVQDVSELLFDDSGNLYGTTYLGGTNGRGSVFELTPAEGTWTLTTLYSFGNYPGDGANPQAGLVFDSAGDLYGTTSTGGSFGEGSVFELSPSGSGGWVESLLYEFQGAPDGAGPDSALVFDVSGNLFGTAGFGGLNENYCILDGDRGCGILYELTPGGGGWTETIVHAFGANEFDGHFPNSAVTFDASGDLFGTTFAGGGGGCGTTCGIAYGFAPSSGGWKEHVLVTFSGRNGSGVAPSGGLLFGADGNLYGTTVIGGSKDCGTLYTLRRTSGGFTPMVLYNFKVGADGYEPVGLVFDVTRTDLYGAAAYGGNDNYPNGDGTIFSGHVGK